MHGGFVAAFTQRGVLKVSKDLLICDRPLKSGVAVWTCYDIIYTVHASAMHIWRVKEAGGACSMV